MKIKKLGDISEKVILKSLEKSGGSYIATYKLSKSWINIVGDNIAKMVKVYEIKNDGCLTLKITNMSYIAEVNSYKELIIDRINIHMGQNYISQVVIIS